MNNLSIESCMIKYGVSDAAMSVIATSVLENKTLSECSLSLSKLNESSYPSPLTLKQIFVVASVIASSIMGDELSEIAPSMTAERTQMLAAEPAVASLRGTRNRATNLEDGIMEYLAEIEAEFQEVY